MSTPVFATSIMWGTPEGFYLGPRMFEMTARKGFAFPEPVVAFRKEELELVVVRGKQASTITLYRRAPYALGDGKIVELVVHNDEIEKEPVLVWDDRYLENIGAERTRAVGLGQPDQPPETVTQPDRSDEANDEI